MELREDASFRTLNERQSTDRRVMGNEGPRTMPADNKDSQARKLVAILAADVAGYSRLMADNEAATVVTLTQYREVFLEHVQGHKGRIVDTTGDSVMATFDSVVEAVEAAVDIQEVLAKRNEDLPGPRRMHFRIGVNLGDIIVRDDGTIYGDGVNVAARLEGLAEPGGVMVSESAHMQIEDKLDVGLEDAGAHEVKNIAKPVRAYRVLLDGSKAGMESAGPTAKPLRRPKVIAGLVTALAVVAGLAVWGITVRVEVPQMVTADGTPTDDPVLAIPTGPTVAVLPFRNVGDDPEQAFFVDGLTDDIINGLSKFHDFRVIARDSTVEYQGEAIDVRQVGEALNANFLVQGSIRRFHDMIKVTVQIQDAKQGSTIWANTYERTLTAAELFQLQVEIANQVIATVGEPFGIVPHKSISGTQGKDTATLKGYECVLRTYDFYRTFRENDHARVRDCLERTIEESPRYADAWAWLAYIYNEEHAYNYNARPEPLDRALSAAKQAIELDPTNFAGWGALADTYFFRRDIDAFFQAGEKAISLNPNDSTRVALIGGFMAWSGDWDRGMDLVAKAMRLNPNHPGWVYMFPAANSYRLRQYDETLSWARKINMPDSIFEKIWGAVGHAQLGNSDAAREELDDLLDLEPNYLIDPHGEVAKYFAEPAFIDHVVAGLEEAGLFDKPEASSRPVIAVLPFDNMSGDPEQEYFADGITEDIITRLAQFPNVLVLGRNTTFQFKGQAVDIPTIAEKLKADYVVEGSIRRGGDTVRVTAQLLGGDGGTHVWAETFDRKLDPNNLFSIQDEITEAVASRIGDAHGAVGRAELEQLTRHLPEHLSSYECVLKFYHYIRIGDQVTHLEARTCLEQLVLLEPGYAEAWAFLGSVYRDEIVLGLNRTEDSSIERSRELAEKAVTMSPQSGPARVRLSNILVFANNPTRAVREAEEAVRLAPNDVDVISFASWTFELTGAYDRADEMMEKVTLLNPNYPSWMNFGPAKGHIARGEFDQAVERIEMAGLSWWYWTQAFLAACLCASGDLDAGQEALDKALEANPKLADIYWQEMYFFNKGPKVRPLMENIAHGLEACGWDVPADPGPEAFAPTQ